MVTVVSQGGEPPKRITCRDCYTELEYFKSDVKYDWLLREYVECPSCLNNAYTHAVHIF